MSRVDGTRRVEKKKGKKGKKKRKKEKKKKRKPRSKRRKKRDTKTRGRDAVSNYATELDAIDGRAFRAELQDSTTSFHFPNSGEPKRTP